MIRINLNDRREFLTSDSLLKYVSDYDIFRYYIGHDFIIGRAFKSPLREDTSPSFSIFISSRAGNPLLFKDFGTGETGGAVKFVQLLHNIDYNEALERIVFDFRLTDKFRITKTFESNNKVPKRHSKEDVIRKINVVDIKISSRNWNLYDKEYWYDKYNIKKSTLDLYEVKPLKYIFINDKVFKADRLAYAYIERKDDETRYKIYQPYSKFMKWINNFVPNTLSGYRQLPEIGDLLFITSSLKDGLVLRELGYNFIAPQSEGYVFKESLIDEMRDRFKKVVIFYDADTAGITSTHKLAEKFNLKYIFVDEFIKDVSDYIEIKGKEKTKKFIENELQKPTDIF